MLVSPMRPHNSSPFCASLQSYSTPLRLPHTQELRSQVLGAMLSVMPITKPLLSKKPKLSLQTTISPSPSKQPENISSEFSAQSPTTRNTRANSSARLARSIRSDNNCSPTTFSINPTSQLPPSSQNAPYILPIGLQSILRNSPLPRPRRLFRLVKEVKFHEPIVHVIPIAVVDDNWDKDNEGGMDGGQGIEQETFVAEDGHAMLICKRRRKKRDFTWRPLDDNDVLIAHHLTPGPVLGDTSPQSLPSIMARETTSSSGALSEGFAEEMKQDPKLEIGQQMVC